MTGARTNRGTLRAARAATFGVLAVALAGLAHVAEGGPVPELALVAVLTLPVAAICFWLSRSERGPVALIGVLGATQWFLHQSFMTLGSLPSTLVEHHATYPGSSVAAHAGTHVMASPSHPMTDLVRGPLLPGTAMTIAHIGAAVVLGLAMAHGERLLALLVSIVGQLVRPRALLVLALPAAPNGVLIAGSQAPVHPWSFSLPVGRRGPP